MGNVTADKAACRASARARRASISMQDAARWNERIHKYLESLLDADELLSYVARGDEVATAEIITVALVAGRRVLVPYVDHGSMEWAAITSLDDLAPGAFGLREPGGDLRIPARPQDSSIVLVPCLAFNQHGHRLGYGGGYFDRFLSSFPGTKIALAYEMQRDESFPVEAHDVSVDYVVTEAQIHDCRTTAESD